ncbi:DUF3488 and transglutaminase-like domain-containing protein [Salinarchaeum sp. IM2453]|uniref:transglutaminase-like domain-containing protein n=1 Tax=Salinarchaeum sp. IM2453 TaxID=2862870 RepID=UPI001C8369B4|nr:transglutaminase-like domain-containing protein [Salinarchaeum sp. IM2453]QZA89650.1 DUF3488 and transglutaminase-like domain-containing protein [Salinarchaeum sp. IM2453]
MTKDKTSDRRFSQLAVALLLLGAIILIASILPAIGGPGLPDTENPFDGPQMGDSELPFSDGSGTSPVLGADQQTSAGAVDNPFEGLSSDDEWTAFYAELSDPNPYKSSVGPYWRSDAYNTYEDGDWVRESGSADPPHLSSEDRFTQEINLEYPTTVLPAAYHADISSIESSEISISDLEYSSEGGIHVASTPSDGFSYEIDSVAPAASTDDLEDAPSDLPTDIEERYTDVPSSVPDRVENFIDREGLEGDSQYETAKNVEQWIQTEKEYSLDAAHERGSDPVDQFLYEMDEGYCQYAASSMALVLQAEDIPTRYVTGYATGDYVGNDRYEVTNQHAHAWVEVYFPNHGWIAFEPTPPEAVGGGESVDDEDERDEQDGDSDQDEEDEQDESDDSDEQDESDEGDEQDESDDSDEQDESDDGDEQDEQDESDEGNEQDDSDTSNKYDVMFDPEDPSVGEDIIITVKQNNEPVSNTDVQIVDGVDDDWYETNESGQIEYTVPPTDSIQVVVSEESESFNTFSAQTYTTESDQSTSTETSIGEQPVDSQLNISALREPLLVGEQASLEFTLDDEPLDTEQLEEYNFTVMVEGSSQDLEVPSEGIGIVDIPSDVSDSAEITAKYGNLSSESMFDAGELEVDTSYEYYFALPGQGVTMDLYVDDTQLENVPVEHDGNLLTPDSNGTIATTLPFSSSVSYTVAYGPNQITHEVNILRDSAIFLGVALTGLLASGVLYRRSNLSVASIYSTLRSGVFHAINQMISVTAHIAGLLRVIGEHLTGGIQSILALPNELYQRWRQWRPDSIPHAIWIRIIAVGLLFRNLFCRSSVSSDSSSFAKSNSEPVDQSMLDIRETWGAFVRMVLPRRYHTKSPGEVARKAVSIGFPKTPVQKLTSVFRQSEYGGGPAEQHVTEANQAFDSIQQSQEDDPSTTDK